MGVRGLYDLITTRAPSAIKNCNYNMYYGRIVAIDASIQIYKYLHNLTKNEYYNSILLTGKINSHLHGLFSITSTMIGHGIKPLYVFDGKPPELKSIVLEKRDVQKKNTLIALENMIKATDNRAGIEVADKLAKVTEILESMTKDESNGPNRLVKHEAKSIINLVQQIVGTPTDSSIKNPESFNQLSQDEGDFLKNLTYDEARIAKKSIKMNSKHVNECKKLLDLMGIPYIQAPSEAEAQCAALCKAGTADAVVSEDLDTLAFSSPTLLRNFFEPHSKEAQPISINLNTLLNHLDLNQKSFIDLCILMGCDYCDTIRGLGPRTALKLIKQYGDIETILKHLDNKRFLLPDNFNYEDARGLFLTPNIIDIDQADFKWKKPDKEGLIEFLVQEKSCIKDKVLFGIKKLEIGLQAINDPIKNRKANIIGNKSIYRLDKKIASKATAIKKLKISRRIKRQKPKSLKMSSLLKIQPNFGNK